MEGSKFMLSENNGRGVPNEMSENEGRGVPNEKNRNNFSVLNVRLKMPWISQDLAY
jgi:hypothetical protein